MSRPNGRAPLVYATWMSQTKRLRIACRTRVGYALGRWSGVAYTCFAVELGRAYEFDKKGDLVKTLTLPARPCEFSVYTGGPCD